MAKLTSKTVALIAVPLIALLVGGVIMFAHHRDRGGTPTPPGPRRCGQ